jgi:V-type H+-transporting ATPase subunit A
LEIQEGASIRVENTNSMAKDSERKRQEAGEDRYGAVFSVSGPVIVAENMIGCAMYELVSYGFT